MTPLIGLAVLLIGLVLVSNITGPNVEACLALIAVALIAYWLLS